MNGYVAEALESASTALNEAAKSLQAALAELRQIDASIAEIQAANRTAFEDFAKPVAPLLTHAELMHAAHHRSPGFLYSAVGAFDIMTDGDDQ